MKGRNPTVAERKMMAQAGLNSENWLVTKNTSAYLEIQSRNTEKQKKILPKEGFK